MHGNDRIAVLVLGLGNVLLGDDGLGAAAVALVEEGYEAPDGVLLAEGGTLGLDLLDLIARADHVVLVDAVQTDDAPGTLVRMDGADVTDAVRDRLSVHQVGVADLLNAAALIGCYPHSVTLLGIVPQSIDLVIARSPAVEAALPALAEAVVQEVKRLGYPLAAEPAPARERPIHSLTRHFGM